MTLFDDIITKFVKLRGSGKDVYSSLLPIFSAMDTRKNGELAPAEFKTCLLAIGIRASEEKIAQLFESFDRVHLRPGYRIAYAGFVKQMVESMPPLPSEAPSSPQRFVSALVAPTSPTTTTTQKKQAEVVEPPKVTISKATFYPSAGFGGTTVPLSDDVGDFEEHIAELERTLTEICSQLQQTRSEFQETCSAKDDAENNGVSSASRASEEIENKNQEIASLNSEISDLAESIKALKKQENELKEEVAAKELIAKKNRIRRKDKDAMISQLTKATTENETQLAELQAVADELLKNLHDTETVIGDKNAMVSSLLSPSKPPQSVTLKTVKVESRRQSSTRGNRK
jgi:hypothetical protein